MYSKKETSKESQQIILNNYMLTCLDYVKVGLNCQNHLLIMGGIIYYYLNYIIERIKVLCIKN